MPTGYTSAIEDGKITNGKDFIKRCSRAFGALSHMREDSLTERIRKAEYNNYYDLKLEEEKSTLDKVLKMSDEDIRIQIEKEYESTIQNYDRMYKEGLEKNKKYDKILEEILAWIPPTKEHNDLKEFAVNQIEISKNSYFFKYKDKIIEKPTIQKWKKDKLDKIMDNMSFYLRKIDIRHKRVNENNKWIDDLLKSLE